MKRMLSRAASLFVLMIFLCVNTFPVSAASEYKSWLQSDSRWGSKVLGSSGDTMSKIGCVVTSMAMLVVHSGSKSESSFNPGTLCDYLSNNGGFSSDGDIYWGAVTGLVSSFTFQGSAKFSKYTQSNITSEIKDYISQGYYIILSVNNDAHWVAVDTISNGQVLMMDPAQNSTNKLFDRYNASGITQARLYKGKNKPAAITTTPTTNNYLTGHYKTTSALNLRASYSTSSSVLLTIPKDETVVVMRIYDDEWGQIEYKNKTGWIYLEYTTYTESSYSYKKGSYKCNASSGVYMRNGIGTDKGTVCLVPYNGQVTVSSVSNNWGKATYNSKSGWICMEYLTYVPETTTKVTTTVTKPTTTTTVTAVTTTAKATTAKTTTVTEPVTKVTTTAKTTTVTKTVTNVTTAKATTATVKVTAAKTTVTAAATTAATVTTDSSTLPIRGDINRDGQCTKEDLVILNRYLAVPYTVTMYDKYVMDVNGDSYINKMDAVYLIRKIKL